ncbi:MAG: fused MFS/spermidine synthase [Acidobacteria bacterium]|nr:fused MFS/spermidine synthase [Acidobacteriota bacterium]
MSKNQVIRNTVLKWLPNPILPVYTVTLFSSAFLVFLVQPMIGKMILPLYGGTSSVWNTCLFFFQGTLLLGYMYAHYSSRWLGSRRQALLHIPLMSVVFLVLPFFVSPDQPPAPEMNPVLVLLVDLAVVVGLPFFVVASSSPLLQRWFSQTTHPAAADPYFLYAASNAGSILALLAYPFLAEPLWTLWQQASLWRWGYGGLVLLTALCALLLWRHPVGTVPGTRAAPPPPAGNGARKPTTKERLIWLFAAFVPSSLMLGVTAHITTNIAAVPLLWVLPLVLYLLTFVLVFARRRLIPAGFIGRVVPLAALVTGVFIFMRIRGTDWLIIPLHLLLFFILALLCHAELARRRPDARYLTDFYLWMSLGGVSGGIFNAVIAPLLFPRLMEYPLAIVLACLLLPDLSTVNRPANRRLDWLMPLGLAALAVAMFTVIHTLDWQGESNGFALLFAPLALLGWLARRRPLRFGLSLAVILAAVGYFVEISEGQVLYASRNFFGLKRIVLDEAGGIRRLAHGTTLHGAEYTDPADRRIPLAYYHPSGPIGDVFRGLMAENLRPAVGAVGLGVGSVAAYMAPAQSAVFYEIDPEVIRIARDPRYFHFLADCRGEVTVIQGDGRLALAAAPDHHYGLLVMDAFSSDAIPVHLLTREALDQYRRKLRPDGLLAFHVSNRYVDLSRLLANLAAEADLVCLSRIDTDSTPAGKEESHWVVLGRASAVTRRLRREMFWRELLPQPRVPVWTDHYSNILSIIK